MTSTLKSRRLGPVNALAQREAEELAQRYAAVGAEHQRQRDKLLELQQYYEEYRCQASTAQRCDLKQLQEGRMFLSRLAQAIAQQQGTVSRCAKHLDDLRLEWLAAQRHSQSMEHLLKRYQCAEQRDCEAREQRDNDELAAQQFAWRRNRA